MADKNKITRLPTYGSLAYDFQTAIPRPKPEWEAVPQPERKVVIPAAPEFEEQGAPQRRPRPRQTISPVSILGFACAAVMLVFMLIAKIQLTVITDQAVALESELSSLSLEQNRLLIEYESVFNRSEIEEYAMSTLGMQRPREEQIVYLNSTAPDKAVVLETDKGTGGFFNELGEMLGFVTEYFG